MINLLFLAGNMITFIHPCAFVGMRKLHNLDLSSNRLTVFQKETFADLHSLFRLDLHHNHITSIYSQYHSTTNAQELIMHGNRIRCSLHYFSTLRCLGYKWIIADCISNGSMKAEHGTTWDNKIVPRWRERMEWSCIEDCGLRSYVRTATCIAFSNSTD